MVRDGPRQEPAGDEAAPTAPRNADAAASPATGDVTRILSQIERGDGRASEQLLPLVYDELRRLAAPANKRGQDSLFLYGCVSLTQLCHNIRCVPRCDGGRVAGGLMQ